MFAPTRILAPVDFSNASEAALRQAIDLAARTGAELHVLHVVPDSVADREAPFDERSEEDRAFYQRLWDRADGMLAAFLDRMPVGDVGVKQVLSRGRPACVALDYAEEAGADLIVIGTQGHRGLRRFFLGSVAEEVLRRARVPVLVVPEAWQQEPVRLVIAPTDFSDASREALPVAAALAARYEADLALVHVLEPIRSPRVEIPAGLLPGLRADAERRLEALVAAPDLAATVSGEGAAPAAVGGVRVLERAPARLCHYLVEGRAAEAIAKVARSRKAGAIVMARRGLHGVERLLLGSVTERLCRLAPCPILVVPAQGAPA